MYRVENPVRYGVRALMLPSADDRPARRAQLGVDPAISRPIPLNLWAPIRGVGAGSLEVRRTPVPVAAVDEHRYARRPKHEICCPARVTERATGYPIAKPAGVNKAPDGHLGSGVPLAVPPHHISDGLRRRP